MNSYEPEWMTGETVDVSEARVGQLVDIETYGPVGILDRAVRDDGVVFLIGTPRGRVYGPFKPGTRLPLL